MEEKVKVPRYLKYEDTDNTVAVRPHLHIDDLEDEEVGDATALDIVPVRPSYRTRLEKKAARRLKEMEELREFGEKKVAFPLGTLEEILREN